MKEALQVIGRKARTSGISALADLKPSLLLYSPCEYMPVYEFTVFDREITNLTRSCRRKGMIVDTVGFWVGRRRV